MRRSATWPAWRNERVDLILDRTIHTTLIAAPRPQAPGCPKSP